MKKILTIVLIVSFAATGCYSPGRVAQSDRYGYQDNYDNADVSYQTFYSDLQPYGNWINYPGYGNVWQPFASRGFRPYETSGHWVSTVDGWAWASDYNWGWAPFHYGRWLFDQSIGWAWVPGYEWAPAWVTWGQYNDYYAWAPLAPGINISFGNTWRVPSDYWSFVPRNCIGYSNLNKYTVRNNYNTNVNNITIINNYNSYNQKDYYHRGPDYGDVERYTHKTINPVNIASAQKPGVSRIVRKQFEIYRPSMSGNKGSQNQSNTVNPIRQYSGAAGTNSQIEGNNKQPNTRNYENLRLKNAGNTGNSDGIFSNGINNSGNTNNTPQNIDNTNRRLQQQVIRNNRTQTSQDNISPAPDKPVRVQQFPGNNQQVYQQNNVIQDIKNNPVDNSRAVRSQPVFQNDRNIQRPAFPQQNERISRPAQVAPAPDRLQRNIATPPARPIQAERPARTLKQF